MNEVKTYLGDGVYVTIENGMIKLTAENGLRATDTIYLEREVMAMLVAWCQRHAPVCLRALT